MTMGIPSNIVTTGANGASSITVKTALDYLNEEMSELVVKAGAPPGSDTSSQGSGSPTNSNATSTDAATQAAVATTTNPLSSMARAASNGGFV